MLLSILCFLKISFSLLLHIVIYCYCVMLPSGVINDDRQSMFQAALFYITHRQAQTTPEPRDRRGDDEAERVPNCSD